jgi:FemAB-related protein (PEP-CTERM system-associated)
MSLVEEQRRYDFVVFSDDWGRHASSCQHLFARIGREHRVLWVNTIGLRAPKTDSFTFFRVLEKIREWCRPLKQVDERFHVLSPMMLPVFGHGLLAKINRVMVTWSIRRTIRKLGLHKPVLWTTVPTAVDYVGQLRESMAVYYVTDDYRLWPGGNAEKILAADRELTQKADVIFACSERLEASHKNEKGRTVPLPHAVDYEHFSSPEPEPEELARIAHPRACFFGLIYEKIDLESLRELATARPEIQIVMIGPIGTDVSRLEGLANVHFLGAKPYAELPAYLQAMDCFVMLYVPDDSVNANGPLKIRECLAVGKPVVARSIPNLESMGDVVDLYHRREDFVATVDRALATEQPGRVELRRARVRNETWESRVKTIMHELDAVWTKDAVAEDDVMISTRAENWEPYLAKRTDATIFHDPRWGQVMERVYGNRAFYLTAFRDEKIVGTLMLVEQKSAIFGSRLCSVPYFDSAGILADDDQAVRSILASAGRVRQDRGAKFAELRQETKIDEILPTRSDKVRMELTLPASSDALWKGLDAKVRNQVRKGQSSGLTLKVGGIELVDDFYRVYVRNMRDLGSPPHGRDFFRAIVETFTPASAVKIFAVYDDKNPLAASLTLQDHERVHVPWAASDWREKKRCPNMFLYWSMLDDACKHDAKFFDFGRSTKGAGTWQFKKQWGSVEVPLYWQYLMKPGTSAPMAPSESGSVGLAMAMWRKLPVSLAGRLGPYLIGKLS